MELTETDVRVLRTLSGQEGGITGWGAAVGASIEFSWAATEWGIRLGGKE
jgi:hypothetical protein